MKGARPSRLAIGALFTFSASVVGVTFTGGAAFADGPLVVNIDTPSQTVNYGSYWTVNVGRDMAGCVVSTVKVTDTGTGVLFAQPDRSYGGGYVFNSSNGAPLSVGTHALRVEETANCFYGPDPYHVETFTASTTATIIVKPAPVTLDFRIVTDPNQANNATVTVQAHGDFVDQLVPSTYRSSSDSLFPAGTWKVEVLDAAKRVVFAKEVDQPAGSATYLSEYWTDVPGGEQFTGTASYEVAGSDPSTIDVSSVSSAFTSAKDSPSSTTGVVIDPEPSAAPAPRGSVSIPALAVIGGVILGVVALAILIASVVISLRRRRASPPGYPADDSLSANEGLVNAGSTT